MTGSEFSHLFRFPLTFRNFKKFSCERKSVSSSSPIKTLIFPVRVFRVSCTRSLFCFLNGAEPSNPLSTAVENPEPSSPTAAEEEADVNAPDKSLPVLRRTESSFQTLMMGIQMPEAYGAMYPQEGDTAGDAPVGYVSMFSYWFSDCNFRLPLTGFVVEILEYYKIHISQLSSLGMIRVRNFKYTFRALSIEPSVGDKHKRKKKVHEEVIIPPLVPEATGILRTRLCKYEDYVVVSDTLEGLGVLGGSSGAVGATVNPWRNRSPCLLHRLLHQKWWTWKLRKKGGENPSIEVVSSGGTPPSVHAKQVSKKPRVRRSLMRWTFPTT
ncbi:hypothetical protein Hanom_Chr06g00559991 [Helianthus anomalus]